MVPSAATVGRRVVTSLLLSIVVTSSGGAGMMPGAGRSGGRVSLVGPFLHLLLFLVRALLSELHNEGAVGALHDNLVVQGCNSVLRRVSRHIFKERTAF